VKFPVKHTGLLVLLLLFKVFAVQGHDPEAENKGLTFIENKSQWLKNVLFKADIPGGFLYLEKNSFTYDFIDPVSYQNLRSGHGYDKSEPGNVIKAHCLKAVFQGANLNTNVTGLSSTEGHFNYFIGNDPARWASNVKAFQKISYQEIYPSVDLEVYSLGNSLKYDFRLRPGANLSSVTIEYQGAEEIQLKSGNLMIRTSVNEIIEQRPYAYQVIDGKEKRVECKFVLRGSTVSFAFPKGYDTSKELVIDPVLMFSTYSGSFANNFGFTSTFDSKGYLYSGSIAFGTGYPATVGAYDLTFNGGNVDIAVTKYDTTGTYRIFATYLGGANGDEMPHSLVVNSNDELFVYGTTGSSDYPTTASAFSIVFNGGPSLPLFGLGVNFPLGTDIIVSKLSNNGSQLLASTLIGGTHNDGINWTSTTPSLNTLRYNYADEVRGEIDIDGQNNVFIVSCTRSSDFPILGNTFQPNYGGGALDGILIKMDNDLTNIIWSSYFGGSDHDAGYSLAINTDGDVYIAGGTNSGDFPTTPGALNPNFSGGRSDGFILRVNSFGTTIMNSTYFGSSEYDQIYFVEADRRNDIYVFGQTEISDSTLIRNVVYAQEGGGQFVSKLTGSLDSLIFSTAFGSSPGSPNISPTAFMVDVCTKIYLSGWGGGTNRLGNLFNNASFTTGLPTTPDAFQTTTDGSDFYLMVLEQDASSLVFASFFGGSLSQEHVDGGTSRFDRKGKIYHAACAGCFYGPGSPPGRSDFPIFPNPGAVSPTNNSNCNSAVFKIDFALPMTVADYFDVQPRCAPADVQFANSSIGSDSTTYLWNFGDNTTSTLRNPTHNYPNPGVYTVSLITFDPYSCNFSDTITKQLILLSDTSYTIPPVPSCGAGGVQIGVNPGNSVGLTYQWSPPAGLSATNVPNPFATVNQDTEFRLIMSNGLCRDTIYQSVIILNSVLTLTPDTFVCGQTPITLVASTSGDYPQYQWSSNPGFSDMLNNSLQDSTLTTSISAPTKFYLRARYGGCVLIDSVSVMYFNDIAYSLNNLVLCITDSVTLGNGLPPDPNLTYSWSPTAGLSDASIASPKASPSQTTVYRLLISNGICTDSIYQTVNVIDMKLFPTPDTVICSRTSIVLTADSEGSATAFLWSSDPLFSDTLQFGTDSLFTFSPEQGNNFVYVKAMNTGCEISDTIAVALREVILDAQSVYLCWRESATLAAIPRVNEPLTWLWRDAAGNAIGSESSIIVSPAQNTNYLVSAENNFGCRGEANVSVELSVLNNELISASASKDTVYKGETILLSANPPGFNYRWSPSNGLSQPNAAVTEATPNQSTVYTLTVSDSICVYTDSVSVTYYEIVCADPFVFVPNSFSPNNDKVNDVLFVRGLFIEELHFMIFNRWGEMVFETKDITKGWDGNYKGMAADPGVFVYYLNALCVDGQKYTTKGNITLIR
jgi:gliding motility-associated-like protein